MPQRSFPKTEWREYPKSYHVTDSMKSQGLLSYFSSLHPFVGKKFNPFFLSDLDIVREAQGAILGSGDSHYFHSLIQRGTVRVIFSILSRGKRGFRLGKG
jgi:hypothetical protein